MLGAVGSVGRGLLDYGYDYVGTWSSANIGGGFTVNANSVLSSSLAISTMPNVAFWDYALHVQQAAFKALDLNSSGKLSLLLCQMRITSNDRTRELAMIPAVPTQSNTLLFPVGRVGAYAQDIPPIFFATDFPDDGLLKSDAAAGNPPVLELNIVVQNTDAGAAHAYIYQAMLRADLWRRRPERITEGSQERTLAHAPRITDRISGDARDRRPGEAFELPLPSVG